MTPMKTGFSWLYLNGKDIATVVEPCFHRSKGLFTHQTILDSRLVIKYHCKDIGDVGDTEVILVTVAVTSTMLVTILGGKNEVVCWQGNTSILHKPTVIEITGSKSNNQFLF